ncbi:hypothetical protein [Actinoplanes sp. DH11]|uniref:hypothetical protein n=1 Tax=Actinoplanes sp. DH11 TaxID=2857011 RepID=UPI001E3564B6|nr:hypothetical protein [Actinoplanes sp. DH11]
MTVRNDALAAAGIDLPPGEGLNIRLPVAGEQAALLNLPAPASARRQPSAPSVSPTCGWPSA